MRHPGNDSQVKSVGSASGIYTPVKSQIPPQQGVLHQLPDGCIQISFLVFVQLFDRLAEGRGLLTLGDVLCKGNPDRRIIPALQYRPVWWGVPACGTPYKKTSKIMLQSTA